MGMHPLRWGCTHIDTVTVSFAYGKVSNVGVCSVSPYTGHLQNTGFSSNLPLSLEEKA